jgi:hypothetical protein
MHIYIYHFSVTSQREVGFLTCCIAIVKDAEVWLYVTVLSLWLHSCSMFVIAVNWPYLGCVQVVLRQVKWVYSRSRLGVFL